MSQKGLIEEISFVKGKKWFQAAALTQSNRVTRYGYPVLCSIQSDESLKIKETLLFATKFFLSVYHTFCKKIHDKK